MDGTQEIPSQPPPYFVTPIDVPDFEIDGNLARRGGAIFGICGVCHGNGYGVAGGMAPDLRASPIPVDDKLFEDVVRGGSRTARGMPAYAHLSDRDLKALQHFIRWAARTGLSETVR